MNDNNAMNVNANNTDRTIPLEGYAAEDPILAALRLANPYADGEVSDGNSNQANDTLASILSDTQTKDSTMNTEPSFASYTGPKRTKQFPRWAPLAAAAAVGGLIAGGLVTLWPGSTTSAEAAVQQAASNTAAITSGQATVEFDIEAASDSETDSLSGGLQLLFDGQDYAVEVDLAETTVALPPLGFTNSDQMEARLVDGTVYFKSGDAAWMGGQIPEAATSRVFDFADARTVLDILNELTDVSNEGSTTIDDIEVTHYSGQVDLADPEVAKSAWLNGLGKGVHLTNDVDGLVSFELYLTNDDLIKRIEATADLVNPDDSNEQLEATITTDFSRLGERIAIQAPAEYQDLSAMFDHQTDD